MNDKLRAKAIRRRQENRSTAVGAVHILAEKQQSTSNNEKSQKK